MHTLFKFYENALELQYTLMDEWITGQNVCMQHALDFQKETQKMMEKAAHPLTIFSPDIMREAGLTIQQLMRDMHDESPQAIYDIYARYSSDMEYLLMQIASGKTGQDEFKSVVDAPNHDRRFHHEAWSKQPYFRMIKQMYLVHVRFFEDVLDALDKRAEDDIGAPSVDQHARHDHHVMDFQDMRPFAKNDTVDARDKWRFYMKQVMSALSPTNFPAMNPEVIEETTRTRGQNLRQGFQNFMRDMDRGYLSMTDMDAFQVGHTLASTPGHVVFENDILQLIRYTPHKAKIFKHPVLIVPAWINKYYLFDLTSQTSFVTWCLERGMDVYIISWINPKAKEPSKTFCDYTLQGLYQAVRFILKNSNTPQLNAVGNCAGGILLNCLMAYLESHNISSPFASATTLASPINGDKLGDLKTFICKNQINMLEESLDDFSIIPGHILVQSFNLLRPQELLWSFYIKHYLMGKEPEAFDILFWNCDSMNLPGRMHSQYLRNIFLDNKLMKSGAMRLGGTPIDLSTIKTPSFILGAKKDHIAPWQSVYGLMQRIQSPIKEFVLTGSGHVSGVMNHPSRNKYQYWTNPKTPVRENAWMKDTTEHVGSWWVHWERWVQPFLGECVEPASNVSEIEPAPGRYVLEKSSVR